MITAVILAGGLGTRLRSVLTDLPKPMAPIHDRPFLEYQMDYLIQQGVDRFVLSVGYLHEKVMKHFGDSYRGIEVNYIIERSPLGTGGGLLMALDAVRKTESFFLINGDTYFEVNLQSLSQFAVKKNADWCFSLFKSSDTKRYLGLQLDSNQRIVNLHSNLNEETCLANGGVYWIRTAVLLNQDFLEKFSSGQKISLESDIFEFELLRKSRLFGLEFDATFLDIGIPSDYQSSFSLFRDERRL